MKKTISIITAICLLFAFVACSKKKLNNPITTGDPQALLPTESDEQPTEEPSEAPTEEPTPEPITCTLLSEANGGPGDYSSLGSSEEDDTWGKTHFDCAEAPAEAEIEFEGETYTGEYKNSIYNLFDSFPTHRYFIKDYRFGINGSTGEMVYFIRVKRDEDAKLPDIDDPENETARLARELAAKYLDDIDEYEMELCWIDERKEKGIDTYYYEFIHMAEDGRRTDDYALVCFTSKGTLECIYFGDHNAYPVIAEGYGRFSDLDLEAYMTEVILPCIPEDCTASGEVEIYRAVYAVSPYDGEVVLCVEAYMDATASGSEYPSAYGGIFVLR